MPSPRIEPREADQHTFHRLPREVAGGLVEAGIAAVAPTFVADEYRVSSVRKVGVVRIAGYDVWIRPKTSVRRLFAMLGYTPGPGEGYGRTRTSGSRPTRTSFRRSRTRSSGRQREHSPAVHYAGT